MGKQHRQTELWSSEYHSSQTLPKDSSNSTQSQLQLDFWSRAALTGVGATPNRPLVGSSYSWEYRKCIYIYSTYNCCVILRRLRRATSAAATVHEKKRPTNISPSLLTVWAKKKKNRPTNFPRYLRLSRCRPQAAPSCILPTP